MKRVILWSALLFGAGCTSPSLDGGQWRCETQTDCVSGFVCSTARKVCVQPDNSANGVESDRIVLGTTGPITSGATSLGQGMRDGMEAYFARVNREGGLDGRNVELRALDDGGDPDRALANVQQLVEGQEVFAFLGNVGTGPASKTVPYLIDQQVLSFGNRAGGALLRKDPPDRYVFNYRTSLTNELERTVGFLTGVRSPSIPAMNISLFTESTATMGQLSDWGASAQTELAEVLRANHTLDPADLLVASHVRGTTNVSAAIGDMLKWLAAGREKDGNNQIFASIVLITDPEPAADFVRGFLDELFKIQRGTSPGLEFGLSAEEVAELLNVADVQFFAVSSVDGNSLAEELRGFGSVLTAQGERPYCENLMMTQVVPPLDSNASGLIEYRNDLTAHDPNIRPGWVNLEGYLVARLFSEAVLQHGPGLSTEGLINTIESLSGIDFGVGDQFSFSPSNHQATEQLWGSRVSTACSFEEADLGDPGTPPPPPPPVDGCTGTDCILTGTLTEPKTLTADRRWFLRGTVFIGNGTDETILTIDPGTTIIGEAATTGTLVVRRGSKIIADGTREQPIVFTSEQPAGSRAAGDWGGVILNGYAPINSCVVSETPPCEGFGEGGTGFYGGSEPNDDSGIMRYVRIEFAGRLYSPENELNGLALQGVGAGTVLDYIQIHQNQDDGIEFFGGTVDAKHILVTAAGDDSIDWTYGWRGRLQYAVVQQWPDVGDNGIEADNNGDDDGTLRNAAPRSFPTLANVTLVGSPQSEKSDYGMLLREGTGAKIHNSVVVGFNDACLDIDHSATFDNAITGTATLTGGLTLNSCIMSCAANFEEEMGDPVMLSMFFSSLNQDNALQDPQVRDPYNLVTPDFRPMDGSPMTSLPVDTLMDPWFEATTYIGAVDPGSDWTLGWTTNAPN